MYFTTTYSSPLSLITLASDGEKLIGLWMEGQKYYAGNMKGENITKDDLPEFVAAKEWLRKYFDGGKPNISQLPLAPEGGEFRQNVWKILCEIPYGKCITYGEIAKILAEKMGKKSMSSQAIGGAVGHNPISIIIPCHRVIGANGRLTGYAGGIDKKIKLLKLEGADTSLFK